MTQGVNAERASRKMGPLVRIKTGKLNSNAAVEDGEYPFFTCSQETLRTATYSFDGEYVLLAGNNANGVFPVKYFHGKFDAYQRTYAICSTDPATLDNRFLYYVLTFRLGLLQQLSTGAATKFLTLPILNNIEIPAVPPERQRRIASILSAYDDLIENNNRRIKILEKMAQALYWEWFVNFRFPGHEKVKMVNLPMGKVPEGWANAKLGDLVYETRDAVDPAEVQPTTPYLGLEHLPRKSITLRDWGRAGEVQSTKLRFRKGDILFGKIRPYFHKVGVAPVDGVCSSDTIILRAYNPQHFGLVLTVVSCNDFVDHATRTSQGTKMPRANWAVMAQYPVALPPPQLLSRFDDLIVAIVGWLENAVFRVRNLRHTRDLLLPKLISGELDVGALE